MARLLLGSPEEASIVNTPPNVTAVYGMAVEHNHPSTSRLRAGMGGHRLCQEHPVPRCAWPCHAQISGVVW